MRKLYYSSALVVLTVLAAFNSYAQDFSNKGKDFYFCFPQHVPNATNTFATLSIYITSDKASSGKITMLNGAFAANFNIAANGIQEIQIPWNANIHISNDESNQVLKKSIRLTVDAGKPAVVAYAQQWAGARSAATLLLPNSVLGKRYYAISYAQNGTDFSAGGETYRARSQFQIIAIEDNTVVNITPRKNGVVQPQIQITLPSAGNIYQYQSTDFNAATQDLTGTLIESVASGTGGCMPIAVFSGSSNITLGANNCNITSGASYDPLWQQLYPITTWGKNFGFIPFAAYPAGTPYRVMASEDNTVVSLNGSVVATLNAGEIYPAGFSAQPQAWTVPINITADKPICVAQYAQRSGCTGNNGSAQGDPDMVILNPIEQNIEDITIFSSPRQAITEQWVNILMKTTAIPSFKINGAAPSGPTANWNNFGPLPGYSYLRYSITGTTAARIQSDSGFNAIAYGWGANESYAYSAGTNVKDLYQFVSIANQYATVDFPATCKNTPFTFSMTFPYQPTQIDWDFGALFPAVTLFSPTPTSTVVVNGRTLYKYTLTAPYSIGTAGIYPIKVTAQNPSPDGCNGIQEIEYDLQVFDPPTADFTFANNGCLSDPVQFTDASNAAGRDIIKYTWDFGDATTSNANNPLHPYSTPGPFTVNYSIITDVGCVSPIASHTITLNDPPIAKFNPVTPYCAGKAVTFQDQSSVTGTATLTKWFWDFGDGSPIVTALTNADQIHTYVTAGNYNVTLKVETSLGCQSLLFSLRVIIHNNPIADFALPSVCLPVGDAQFTNQSVINGNGESISGYTWDFGDGGSSAAINPLYNYTGTGPYNVSLTATSNNGCVNIKTKPITTIYARPTAQFNANTIEACIGTASVFTDQSLAPGSTIAEWHWDFGDGNTSLLQSPTHTYATAGPYTVTLYIKSAAGCISNTQPKTITILPLPTASFTNPLPVCELTNLVFTSTAVPNAGTITQTQWLVNTVQSGTGPTFTYSPPSATTYTVQMNVLTDKGCTATSSQSILAHPRPLASFNLPAICLPAGTANFVSSSTISDGSTLTYAWDFGDAGAAAIANPTHNYAGTGPYNVTLVVTSNNGCKDDSLRSLNTINPEPQAAFTAPVEVCLGSTVTFSDNSIATGSTVAQWRWDFGDGSPISNSQNPSHTYAMSGSYSVKLNITSAAGCNTVTKFATQTVTVNPLPTANFNTSLPGCERNNITFTDASTPNAGALVKWTWNFGDASNAVLSSGAAFPHLYPLANTYNVSLTVETDKGCVKTLTNKPVVVNIKPVAGFISPEVCLADPQVPFIDTSKISAGSVTGWKWDFGDPNATPGNPNTSTTQNPTHQYSVVGPYTAKLIAVSNNGCEDTLSQTFTVNGSIPVANFAVQNPAALCSNQQVDLTDASTVDFGKLVKLEVYWDYTNNPTIKTTDDDPIAGRVYTHNYAEFATPATQTHQIRYVAYSGINCVSTLTRNITLLATPELTFTAIRPVCADRTSFTLSDNVQIVNGLTGTGVFIGAGITNGDIFNPAIAGPGNHTLVYTYTAANSCSNQLNIPILVYPTPAINAGPDRVVLEGGYVVLTPALNANVPVTYLWTPPTGLDNPLTAFPKASPPQDMTYTLTVTSDKGCQAHDDVFVKLLKSVVIPNIFSPNGDNVHDKWEINYLDSYPGCTVEIYNRYGQLIYRSIGYSNPWDGTINGKQAPIGTYYYIVDPKNGRAKLSGYVDIIR